MATAAKATSWGRSSSGARARASANTAADAELLLLGPGAKLPHALPPLPAGVTPALISQVVLQELGLRPLVLDLGCPIAPAVPHLRLGGPAGYVGWPLWFHRACLVHNRRFGWLYIAGLAAGAAFPGVRF